MLKRKQSLRSSSRGGGVEGGAGCEVKDAVVAAEEALGKRLLGEVSWG